jgi:beta-glucosidase
VYVLGENSEPKYNWDSFVGLNTEQIEEKAKEILEEMTIEEKLKQMVGMYTQIQAFKLLPKNSEGMQLFEARYEDWMTIYQLINKGSDNKRLGIPPIIFSDGPRGVVGPRMNIRKPTCFPVAIARAATFDTELEERVGNAIGIELRVHKNNFYGGVCINQLYHPRGGRAQESYGEDTYLLGEMGSALVKGVQKHKIMACAKHYAVNNQESTRMMIDVTVDERTLREVFLPHFKKCVDAGVASIMAAYNFVNGIPCGHHTHLLRDILKGDWNFKGFVISDWMLCIRNGKQAILGGMDIEMPWEMHFKVKRMKRLVEKGEIPLNNIDEAVLRILRTKIGFAHPEEDEKSYPAELSACEEHVQLAREAARKGIVLLENNDNFLPLNRENFKRIGVFGQYADKAITGDNGSSRVYPEYVITPYQGIKKIAGEGIEVIYNDGSKIKMAQEMAKSLDVIVIFAGFDYKDEGEAIIEIGGDRKFMTLKPEDISLIEEVAKVNPNVIVVMHSGGSIITESWRENVKAILMYWYGGMEGGNALGEILFGDVNPSAKNPCTFPKSEDQLPLFDREAKKTTYGYYHGYRFIDKHGYEPRYPFGFGLSYTTFSYSNVRLDKSETGTNEQVLISVDVKNTGNIAGDEIVQLYIGYKNSSVDRPVKELKGFGKVSLEPEETKTILIKLDTKDLAYYDVKSSSWTVEKLEYVVYIGPSSREDDLLKANFKII